MSFRSKLTAKARAHRLDEVHIRYLTSYDTLKKWSGFPLPHRCKLFHYTWTDKRITPQSLSKLYRKKGIRLKAVRHFKLPPNYSMDKYIRLVNEVKERLIDAKSKRLRIIYLDETVFTKWTYQTRDYAANK